MLICCHSSVFSFVRYVAPDGVKGLVRVLTRPELDPVNGSLEANMQEGKIVVRLVVNIYIYIYRLISTF